MPQEIERKRIQKRTKIVATIGPASDSEEILRDLVMAGMNVVRINFSHGTADYIIPLVKRIKALREELDVPIAILGDLRGPRMRVGDMENDSVVLEQGKTVRLTPDEEIMGTPDRIGISFSDLSRDVWPGNIILLDDGDIELTVESTDIDGDIVCRIDRGGKLSSHRGINLPGIKVSLPSLSEKDFADVDFAIEQDFDFLALSFVQSADDVRLLNAYLAAKQSKIPVISKIEKKSALSDIEQIVRESYGVMVARGDLALEMSIREVPIAQKRIIAACRRAAKPVITATQMLESMIHSHKPTRAEATDVANAVLDGTDALMLSGETAIGNYPVEVVRMMSTIAARAEQAWFEKELPGPPDIEPGRGIANNVAFASQVMATSVDAKVIATYTTSGATARRVASHRAATPILAFTSEPKTRRVLALSWGVRSIPVERMHDTNRMVDVALTQSVDSGFADPNDVVIMTGSARPYGVQGRTNSLRVERIPIPQKGR